MKVASFPCPECGAPLPVNSEAGRRVRCRNCKTRVRVDDAARDAASDEERARRVAERLYDTVGAPPSLAQRASVLLVNPWLWLFAFPLLIPACGAVLFVPERIADAALHMRLSHVWYPMGSWLLGVGTIAGAAVFLLVFSLYGLRTDARRILQAQLACAPPKLEGGPATCRECGADLVIPAGARGVRCSYCHCDNLVALPPAWVRSARGVERKLELSAAEARKLWAEGRRAQRRGAVWRIPLALGIAALALWPLKRLSGHASWHDLTDAKDFRIALQGASPIIDHNRSILRTVPRCDVPAAMRAADHARRGPEWIDTGPADGELCTRNGGRGCLGVAVVPMRRGETLRLLWRGAPAAVPLRWALAPRHPALSTYVMPLYGERVAEVQLSTEAVAAELPAHITGLHVLNFSAPPETRLLACTH